MRNRELVLVEIKHAVAEERKSQLRVLHLLREIESDGHFLELGYSSLFEFAIQGLGYSAGAAHRRIQSMRFVRAFPEMADKVENGDLSLCVAAKTQGFFKNEDQKRKREGKEKLSSESKKEIAQSMLGASTKECEKKLASISPESAHPPEKTRELSHGKTLIQFSADSDLVKKLESLKGLLAHQNPDGSFEGLFRVITEMALKSVTPKAPREHSPSKAASLSEPKTNSKPNAAPSSFSTVEKPASPKTRSRSIAVEIKRRVFARDGGICTYMDPSTGRKCGSRFALQFDHYPTPFALGGKNTEDNLALRCRAHNIHSAKRLGLIPKKNHLLSLFPYLK